MISTFFRKNPRFAWGQGKGWACLPETLATYKIDLRNFFFEPRVAQQSAIFARSVRALFPAGLAGAVAKGIGFLLGALSIAGGM